MPLIKRSLLFFLVSLVLALWLTIPVKAQTNDPPNSNGMVEVLPNSSQEGQEPSSRIPRQPTGPLPAFPETQQPLTLVKAIMCERVESLKPIHPAKVFSASVGQVSAYTFFDPVPQPTLIHHLWYHRDKLSNPTRLRLYPPRWGTYSVMQLRETDKGPWRVEITDQNGKVLETLRFSITD